ncbi:MAG TPA: hypothetical protein VE487_13655 [Ilumatobacter sp.]|jgi:hypothetical protein|nr:hypothetical protein [Ilumatobacter sp.]
MNNTFATTDMIVDYRDIAAHRPAAGGLAIPAYLRGINSSVWQSALHRSGQRARTAAAPPPG